MRVSLACLLALLVASCAGDDCGGKNSCGSWFSDMDCPGLCCHDSFNAWCCPSSRASAWECNPTFNHDEDHCYAPNSCTCKETDFVVIRVESVGEPEAIGATSLSETECCAAKASKCGVDATVTFTQSQTISWSNTVTTTVSFEADIVIGKLGVSLSDSYTNGQTTERTEEIKVNSPCRAPDAGFQTETFVNLTSSGSLFSVPVKMVYRHCGEEGVMDATVKATVLKQDWDCDIVPCTNKTPQCSRGTGCVADALLYDALKSVESALPTARQQAQQGVLASES